MSKYRSCIVCGKKYEYCPACHGKDAQDIWKTNYCSDNCRQVFKVCNRYVCNDISLNDAAEKLQQLQHINNPDVGIEKVYNEIINSQALAQKQSKQVEMLVDEENNQETNTVSEEIKTSYKPRRRRQMSIEE